MDQENPKYPKSYLSLLQCLNKSDITKHVLERG